MLNNFCKFLEDTLKRGEIRIKKSRRIQIIGSKVKRIFEYKLLGPVTGILCHFYIHKI